MIPTMQQNALEGVLGIQEQQPPGASKEHVGVVASPSWFISFAVRLNENAARSSRRCTGLALRVTNGEPSWAIKRSATWAADTLRADAIDFTAAVSNTEPWSRGLYASKTIFFCLQ